MPNNGIRPITIRRTLNCTWWPLAPSLTLHEVNELGNRAKSVQECLLISVILVAPYSTNMHANHKITSQTTSLKCTWWPLIASLTLHEVSQLGNRTKSVQECLLMSIGLAAPYSAKVPTNPKIISQTSFWKRKAKRSAPSQQTSDLWPRFWSYMRSPNWATENQFRNVCGYR